MYYYVDEAGAVQGPYSYAQIGEWIQGGHLAEGTYVQHAEAGEGAEWVPYGYWDEEQQQQEQDGGGSSGAGHAGGAEASQWDESQWHYLDDDHGVQGPFSTATIGDWLHAGALGAERYVSVDGSDWEELQLTQAFQTLWAHELAEASDGGVAEGVAAEPAAATAAPAVTRRTSVVHQAADRAARRRGSVLATAPKRASHAKAASAEAGGGNIMGGLAAKLSSQKSLLRKTVATPGRRRPKAMHKSQPSSDLSHLMKGLEVRRTIIRAKKRRTSFAANTPALLRMADGSAVPEMRARAARPVHKRRVSEFSESEGSDDGWLDD